MGWGKRKLVGSDEKSDRIKKTSKTKIIAKVGLRAIHYVHHSFPGNCCQYFARVLPRVLVMM